MTIAIPPGWGFGGHGGKPEPAPRVTAAPTQRKAVRKRASNDRTMHMRFALWAQALGRAPQPGETCDHFGVNYETARRLVWDWNNINEEPK